MNNKSGYFAYLEMQKAWVVSKYYAQNPQKWLNYI